MREVLNMWCDFDADSTASRVFIECGLDTSSWVNLDYLDHIVIFNAECLLNYLLLALDGLRRIPLLFWQTPASLHPCITVYLN